MSSSVLWGNLIAVALPALVVFACSLWQGTLKPKLIPKAIIDAVADDLINRFAQSAAEAAFIEEDSAWRRSDLLKQVEWRRVRWVIERRQKAEDLN